MKRKKITMTTVFIGLLVVIAAAVIVERFGIRTESSTSKMESLPLVYLEEKGERVEKGKESLLIVDEHMDSQQYTEQMKFILDSLNVSFDEYVVETAGDPLPDLTGYETVVLSTVQLDFMMEQGYLDTLLAWVAEGGRMMNLIPDTHSDAIEFYQEAFGIASVQEGGVTIEHIDLISDFMIGSQGFSYDLEGFSTYAMNVTLVDGPVVHALQRKTSTPVVWETEYGDGRIVVNNIDMAEKTTRGMIAAQYSLLQDIFAYPVINSSVFFIDDFPAPFPEGHHPYITQFYDMDIQSFFATVWIPDIMKISRDYELPFTNMIINTYEDDTQPAYDEPVDKMVMTFYGNLLLNLGGEIGYHGYNHQPLVLDGFEFSEALGYSTWNSIQDIVSAMNTLIENTKWLFPGETASVYVPPSNILSEEVRAVFPKAWPEIKTIASLYVVIGNEYEQEFTVAPDGVIELPRTVSGLELSTYDRWLAMNELNFHFVNSHFFHPDDLLDPQRGAEKGWEYLKAEFTQYLDWLETVAPGLKNQKASDTAKAIQRYHAARITRRQEGNNYVIEIENFYDRIYCIIRIREGEAAKVSGGSLTPLTKDLYLLEATESVVTIQLVE